VTGETAVIYAKWIGLQRILNWQVQELASSLIYAAQN